MRLHVDLVEANADSYKRLACKCLCFCRSKVRALLRRQEVRRHSKEAFY